jgi:hypothetical protein
MGGYYDKLVAAKLPAGDLSEAAKNEAKKLAGPEVLNATLIIPVILIVAFAILYIYMRSKKQNQTATA